MRAGRSWWPLAIGVVVLVAVVAGLAGAGEDDDDDGAAAAADATTTTTGSPAREVPSRPRRTTTTASTGPLLGEPTGLLVTTGGSRTLLDLDTGEDLEVRAPVLGGHAGRLLVSTGAGLAWWPHPYDGDGAELLAEGIRSDQAWIDPVDGTVWLSSYEDAGSTLTAIGPDGQRAEVRIPVYGGPIGLVAGRMVLGAPGGTFAIAPDGDVAHVSTGSPVAAGADLIFVTICGEQLDCRLQTISLDGAVLEDRPAPDGGGGYGPTAVSATGRLATMEFDPDGTTIVRIDGAVVLDDRGLYVSSMTWSPDGRWLLVALGNGLRAVDATTGVVTQVDAGPGYDGWPLVVVAR